MNKRIKKLWVVALRSGKYQQTFRELHNKTGYCCLGVLCNLYNREKGYGGVKNTKDGYLPQSVTIWAGLKNVNPSVNFSYLTTINDIGNYSFNEIADLIEKYL